MKTKEISVGILHAALIGLNARKVALLEQIAEVDKQRHDVTVIIERDFGLPPEIVAERVEHKVPKKRGRKRWSAAAKKEKSAQMKAYWKDRHFVDKSIHMGRGGPGRRAAKGAKG